jgi:hypothetical protein
MNRSFIFRVSTIALLAACLAFPGGAFAATLSSRSIIMERNEPGASSNQEIRFTTPSGVTGAGDTFFVNYPYGFDLSTIGVGDIDLFYGATTGFETTATLAASAAVGIWGVGISGRVITFTAPTDGGPIGAGELAVVRIGTNASGGANRIVNPGGNGGTPVFVTIDGSFGDTGGFDVPIYQNDSIAITATVVDTTPAPPPFPGPGGGDGPPSTDGTAPVISGIQIINITTSTATIVWNTDESASSIVEYGVFPTYGSTGSQAGLVTSHSVSLTGLLPNQLYNFRVLSSDAVGNEAYSGNLTFTTLPPPAFPVISNIVVLGITDSSAIVSWNTDIPATGLVDFGVTTSYGDATSYAAFITGHYLLLNGLSPNTIYHFRVESREYSGLTSTSGDNTFSTLADLTPPTNVSGFSATAGDGANLLTWNNPPDADFLFVRIRARTDGYPSSESDGRLVYEGPAEAFLDAGLVNGTTYYYTAFAIDAVGNISSGAFAQAAPSATAPPLPPVPTPPTPTPTPGTGPGTQPSPTSPGATTTVPTIPGATTTPPIPPSTIPTTTVPVIPSAITINPSYFAGGGTIHLEEDANGVVGSVPGSPLLVRVPTAGLGALPSSAMIDVDGSRYALTPLPDGTSWGASFIPLDTPGSVDVTVTFSYPDGTQSNAKTTIRLQPSGRVLERNALSLTLVGLGGASVTLYQQTPAGWVIWDGGRFGGQANPQTTGDAGYYGFVVQNGVYRVLIKKDGYVTQEREFRVTQNFASVDVLLSVNVRIPIIGPILSAIQSEQGREIVSVSAPIIAVIAVANLVTLVSFATIFNYLWFIFTQPLLLFGRRKRRKWGVVYNSLSKVPIDLVAVRLVHARTNLILQTRITDVKGRFAFRVHPGDYRVEATRQGYTFPTDFLKAVKNDGDLTDIYHGENIHADEDANLAVNIPLDPTKKEETPRKVYLKAFLRKFRYGVASLSVIVTAAAFSILPSMTLGIILAIQILSYILFLRLAVPKKPKDWGIVYDEKTRKPIGSTVVRIFDTKFNKLLETQITDSKGNYGFFAQKSLYFVTADKVGYKQYKSEDIDLMSKEGAVIDKHIKLQRD